MVKRKWNLFFTPVRFDKETPKLTDSFSWLNNLAEISVPGQPIVLYHYAMRVWNRSNHGVGHLYGLVEAKSEKTVRPPMASPLTSLQSALKNRAGRLVVVHRKSRLQMNLLCERGLEGSLIKIQYVLMRLPGKASLYVIKT